MSLLADAAAAVALPSLKSFFGRVAEEACAGRHGILLTGGWIPESVVREGVHGALYHSGVAVRTVRLLAIDSLAEAPRALAAACGLPDADLQPGAARAQGEALPLLPEVMWLEGLNEAGATAARAWLDYMTATSRFGIAGALVLVVPVGCLPPNLEVPATSPRLAIHRPGGTPSVLEVRLLCRLAESYPPTSPEAQWRESVLSALVGSDLSLAATLWDAVLEDEITLLSALTAASRERQWDASTLDKVRVVPTEPRRLGLGGMQSTTAEARWQRLAQAGLAGTTPEYGLEVGTAALAAREDARAVTHRLWRGQAALLLPRLDELRMYVCEALSRRHGPRWPIKWGRFNDPEDRRRVENDPLACDYGLLENILRNREVNGANFLSAVTLGRALRNELAHYRPVCFRDFKRMCELEAQMR